MGIRPTEQGREAVLYGDTQSSAFVNSAVSRVHAKRQRQRLCLCRQQDRNAPLH